MGLRSIGEIPDAAYVASKAGIIGLTRELASQWGRYGIRVNAVAPGFFASEMTAELGDDPEAFPEFLLARTPLRRGGRAGELDDAVLFLLGAGSSFVTGHVLSVDGGMAVLPLPRLRPTSGATRRQHVPPRPRRAGRRGAARRRSPSRASRRRRRARRCPGRRPRA